MCAWKCNKFFPVYPFVTLSIHILYVYIYFFTLSCSSSKCSIMHEPWFSVTSTSRKYNPSVSIILDFNWNTVLCIN